MAKPTLHLLMGLPGAGKTTLSKILQQLTSGVRISSDDYRLLLFPKPTFTQMEHDNLYAMIDHNVEHLLQAGHDVIYDANLNRKMHRQEKYDLAKRHGAEVRLWWVQVPEELAKSRRLAEQDDRLLPEGENPGRLFDRVAKVIEVPDESEPHIALEGVGLTAEKVGKLLADA